MVTAMLYPRVSFHSPWAKRPAGPRLSGWPPTTVADSTARQMATAVNVPATGL